MLTTRQLDRLTEEWPEDEANLDLAMFAGTFRADRPEMSPPAMERIEAALTRELDRSAAPRVSPMSIARRLSSPVIRVVHLAREAHPYLIRVIPLPTAAAVVLGIGLWMSHRPGGAEAPSGPDRKLIKAPPPKDPDPLVPDRQLPVP